MSGLIEQDATIAKLRASTLQGMREYMRHGDVGYDESHIRRCDDILAEHLRAIEACGDKDGALKHTQQTVLRLNNLNAQCDRPLIETDQREDICAIIIRAGALRGFNGADEDVTEEWREW